MPEQTSDEVMNFIRMGESPATTVKRKLNSALSAARSKVYDTLGPYFNPGYISPGDPRRETSAGPVDPNASFLKKGMESAVGTLSEGNVRSLSMRDTGIDLFDPSPMGEIRMAGDFLGGVPRKNKEVFDLLQRFKIEGWNRADVVQELQRLGHNPMDFMDAIKSQFDRGNMLDAPPLSAQWLQDPLKPGPVDPSFTLGQREAMENRNIGRDFARGMQASPDEWRIERDVSESFRKMGNIGSEERGIPDLAAPFLENQPSVSQRMRGAAGGQYAEPAGEQKNLKGEVIARFFKLNDDVIDPLTGNVVFKKGTKVSEQALELYGIKADRRKEPRLPDEFENMLMKQDPKYVGGKAGRNPNNPANPFNPEFAPRAGGRAFNDDRAQSNLELFHEDPSSLDEDNYTLYQAIEEQSQKIFFEKVNPNQHDRLEEFMQLMNRNDVSLEDALGEIGSRGADSNTLQRLREFWDFLGRE